MIHYRSRQSQFLGVECVTWVKITGSFQVLSASRSTFTHQTVFLSPNSPQDCRNPESGRANVSSIDSAPRLVRLVCLGCLSYQLIFECPVKVENHGCEFIWGHGLLGSFRRIQRWLIFLFGILSTCFIWSDIEFDDIDIVFPRITSSTAVNFDINFLL